MNHANALQAPQQQSALQAQMIAQQLRTNAVHDERILAALERVPRIAFVPAGLRAVDCADAPLPLAHGKHMLSPLLAGRILQAVLPRSGERVLEVGTGSGYLAACLAALGASVQSLEIHADLAAQARANLQSAGQRAEVACADGMAWESPTPFDCIILTASLPTWQPRFERLLAPGGRLFAVVGTGVLMSARLYTRAGEGQAQARTLFETWLEPLEHAPVPETFRF
jgi:protein-L-isoaspartate(D-aspartate) O-methyltransferase